MARDQHPEKRVRLQAAYRTLGTNVQVRTVPLHGFVGLQRRLSAVPVRRVGGSCGSP